MIKRIMILSLLIMCIVPFQAFASGNAGEYYPPNNSDYYLKKWSFKIWADPLTYKVRFTQFKPPENDDVLKVTTFNIKPDSYMWVDQYCWGNVFVEFLDQNGNVVNEDDSYGWTDTSSNYLNPIGECPANSIRPSDYNEEEHQYASDTFGGTKGELDNPETPDGSGGTGETGYGGIDDGSGTGDTDPGTGDGGDDDPSVPNWDEYMDELEQIKNKIPPPPDWDKITDDIAKKVKDGMGDLLGSAPDKPTPPPDPGGTDDRGIGDKVPTGQEDPGLGDSSFNEDDIKNNAPVIPEREDPTGGFDIGDPMGGLPDLPEGNPMPGKDAGEWGQSKPSEPDNLAPAPPSSDGGVPDVSGAPKPSDDGATPPKPGDDSGGAPTPSDSGDTAPIPSDGGDTPPMPGDDSGSAPVPGDEGGTAPMPGDGDGDIGGSMYYKPSPDP